MLVGIFFVALDERLRWKRERERTTGNGRKQCRTASGLPTLRVFVHSCVLLRAEATACKRARHAFTRAWIHASCRLGPVARAVLSFRFWIESSDLLMIQSPRRLQQSLKIAVIEATLLRLSASIWINKERKKDNNDIFRKYDPFISKLSFTFQLFVNLSMVNCVSSCTLTSFRPFGLLWSAIFLPPREWGRKCRKVFREGRRRLRAWLCRLKWWKTQINILA